MKDRKQTILCIDDDQDTLDMLRIALESGGYKVVEALTAEEGLRVFRSANPDLIIVDLMMEEIDAGTRFTERLKALGSDAPIFMLSSVGDSLGNQTDYSELGLAGIFQKPIEPSSLLTTLRKRLERK